MAKELTAEQIQSFVIPCHGQLDKVKAMLAAEPRFLHVVYEPWQESGLGAASHVGNRAIAEFLLAQGAEMTICTAAMLGQLDTVKTFVAADPTAANAEGAHGISVLFHAALSGNTAVTDYLLAAGNNQDMSYALHAAIGKGRTEMVRWLLARGATQEATNFQGKSPLQVAKESGLDDIAALLRAAA